MVEPYRYAFEQPEGLEPTPLYAQLRSDSRALAVGPDAPRRSSTWPRVDAVISLDPPAHTLLVAW